jgi:hypothetical protein
MPLNGGDHVSLQKSEDHRHNLPTSENQSLQLVARGNSILNINHSPRLTSVAPDAHAKTFVECEVHGILKIGLIHRHCSLDHAKVMLSS